jgi:hypothetical protein
LTQIKDADCDPVVGIMSRVSDNAAFSSLEGDLGHQKSLLAFSFLKETLID